MEEREGEREGGERDRSGREGGEERECERERVCVERVEREGEGSREWERVGERGRERVEREGERGKREGYIIQSYDRSLRCLPKPKNRVVA